MATSVAAKRHRVFLQNPGATVPDGDGGYVSTWIDLDPPFMSASLTAPEAVDLERFQANTTIASTSRRVDMSYHPQITTKTRMVLNGRTLSVVGVNDPDELHARLVLLCVEVVQ
jgi:head-tail adaptor